MRGLTSILLIALFASLANLSSVRSTEPSASTTAAGTGAASGGKVPAKSVPNTPPAPVPAAESAQANNGLVELPEAAPGYFGAVTDDRQKLPGVRIVEVVAGGPAEKAGLRAGDLITAVDGKQIREMADLAKLITVSAVGQQMLIDYQRGATLSTPGKPAQVAVTLSPRPAAKSRLYPQFGRISEDDKPQEPAATPPGVLLGVRAGLLDTGSIRRLNLSVNQGALVLEVTPDSPAERAGIPRDATIVSLNGIAIDSPDSLTREILQAGPGAEVDLGYYLGKELIKRRLRLADSAMLRDDFGAPALPHGVLHTDPEQRIRQLEHQLHLMQQRIEVLEQRLNAASAPSK